MKYQSVTNQMKASEQCVHMILVLNHTVQGSLEMTLESVDTIC